MNRLSNISSWKSFANHVRKTEMPLLKNLDKYSNSILVTGCQRSGTTMLSRLIAGSKGIDSYKFTKDDELDAALILSGKEEIDAEGRRYCFQSTYVNECYYEYFKVNRNHKMIWVVRNPYSVIHSFLNNWGRFAFNELFRSCGMELLSYRDRVRLNYFGLWSINKLRRACLAYNGKQKQLEKLSKGLPNIDIMFIEYDELVKNKNNILPEIYDFIGLEYNSAYGDGIKVKSISKADSMSTSDNKIITAMCEATYKDAVSLCNTIVKARHGN